MNAKDASKMILIMSGADGGCRYCAYSLMRNAVTSWPDVSWSAVVKEVRKSKTVWGVSDPASLLERAIEGNDLE